MTSLNNNQIGVSLEASIFNVSGENLDRNKFLGEFAQWIESKGYEFSATIGSVTFDGKKI